MPKEIIRPYRQPKHRELRKPAAPSSKPYPFIPIDNRLIITPAPEVGRKELEMVKGIIIPESSEKNSMLKADYEAFVLAAGSGCKFIKTGDRIIARRSPISFRVEAGGEDVWMIRENDVHIILR